MVIYIGGRRGVILLLCSLVISVKSQVNSQDRWRQLLRERALGNAFLSTVSPPAGSGGSGVKDLIANIYVPPSKVNVWVNNEKVQTFEVARPTAVLLRGIKENAASIAIRIKLNKYWYEKQILTHCPTTEYEPEGSGDAQDLELDYMADSFSDIVTSDKDPLGLEISDKGYRWGKEKQQTNQTKAAQRGGDMVEEQIALEFFEEPQEYAKGTAAMYVNDTCLPIGCNVHVEGKPNWLSGNNWVCRSSLTATERKEWYKTTYSTTGWEQAFKPSPDWKKIRVTEGNLLRTTLFDEAATMWTWADGVARDTKHNPTSVRQQTTLVSLRGRVIPRIAYCRVVPTPFFNSVTRG